jgi:kynureninase
MSTTHTAGLTRADFEALDQADPLATHRDKFELAEGLIYLNGNSLGPMPKATLERMQEVVGQEWGQQIIRGWLESDWVNLPLRIGEKIARLIGAGPGEVIVADSTSVNLFKLACAALEMQPGRATVLSEAGNFPTDLHVLQGIEGMPGDRMVLQTTDANGILEAINEDTALVVLTHVHYKSGFILDMAGITARAHECGALILWDLSHTAGAMPVDLNAAGADFAVGCGYKYLNGGPGSPAYLFVAERHLPNLQQPLTGWFGHANPFAMSDKYSPDPGIKRTLCGTTPVLGACALEVGVNITLSADMEEIRDKSMRMGDLFIQLVEQQCVDMGLGLASPVDAVARGSQVSLVHEHGYAIMQALISRQVVGDFRAPDIIRFGFAPLYTRYVDVWDTVHQLSEIMTSRAWDSDEYKRKAAVT